jgi:hypothetical protein
VFDVTPTPPLPKLVGNVVTPLYEVTPVTCPIAQTAVPALNPPPIVSGPANVNAAKLKLPEPFHTTSGPTCKIDTLKLPDAPDVGVGVGVGVEVPVFVGV